MDNLGEHLAFVKEQAAFHERQALKLAGEPKRALLHDGTATKFHKLARDLSELIEREQKRGPNQVPGIGVSWAELEGLPEELIQELSISESDRTDYKLMSLIEQAGGVASIDRLLVALYKQSGEITKRTHLTARLYRMAGKGLIFAVPGKKGVYSIDPVEDEREPDAASALADTEAASEYDRNVRRFIVRSARRQSDEDS